MLTTAIARTIGAIEPNSGIFRDSSPVTVEGITKLPLARPIRELSGSPVGPIIDLMFICILYIPLPGKFNVCVSTALFAIRLVLERIVFPSLSSIFRS